MQRSAVFVDAGYLFAQGSTLLTGTRQSRELLTLNIENAVQALKATAQDCCGMPVLRIYWYDAMRIGRPTPEQAALADSNDIKIRLGQINSAGEQKGVDALIITDMVELARNHAMTDAILMSGDEDVRVGVVLAQQFGVRVHLVGVYPARSNQSRSLRQEADTNVEWQLSDIAKLLSYVPAADPASAATAATATGLDVLVGQMIERLEQAEIESLQQEFAKNTQIPQQYDRELLRLGRTHYAQQTLTPSEREIVRATFKRLISEQ